MSSATINDEDPKATYRPSLYVPLGLWKKLKRKLDREHLPIATWFRQQILRYLREGK